MDSLLSPLRRPPLPSPHPPLPPPPSYFRRPAISVGSAAFRFSSRAGATSRRKCFWPVPSPDSPRARRGRGPVEPTPEFAARGVRVSPSGAPSGPLSDEEAAEAPGFVEFITSERVKVVAMLALALALCNADRVVMSVVIVPLSLSHGWSRSFAGIVQSSFLWGYLISPIAGGALVDYYGGKIVMAWGVALWSLATFLTPWAAEASLLALLAMRVLLGIAEGVALPCMNKMVARWFPAAERARAVSIAMGGFTLGNAIGLTLSPILMSQGGIYGPFFIFGLSGFLWVLVWLSAITSTPDQHPQISKYELNYIRSGRHEPSEPDTKSKRSSMIPPFKRLLSKMPTWCLIVANAMHSWGFFVILSWMPIYFYSVYHVDLRQAAWYSAVPWSVMAFVGYLGGMWSDLLIQGGTSISLTRKLMQSIGFIGPGIALIGLTTAKQPSIASAWLTLAIGLKSFSHSGFLVNLQVAFQAKSTVITYNLSFLYVTVYFHLLSTGDLSKVFRRSTWIVEYSRNIGSYCGNSWSWFLC
ncbi:hypothetical protein ACJRO7_004889 [Eucalyptus globulus]|uniref:Major facilitator superfamily (MFS) profile domain-containing protein n=1 Tax=Eucalyptus globulus TaxID=34317 RepID=A0ABD3J0Q8_EUCGL